MLRSLCPGAVPPTPSRGVWVRCVLHPGSRGPCDAQSEQAAQASPWPTFSPAPARPVQTPHGHAMRPTGKPSSGQSTAPCPQLATPLHSPPAPAPPESLYIFLPLVRWGHFSQGLL